MKGKRNFVELTSNHFFQGSRSASEKESSDLINSIRKAKEMKYSKRICGIIIDSFIKIDQGCLRQVKDK